MEILKRPFFFVFASERLWSFNLKIKGQWIIGPYVSNQIIGGGRQKKKMVDERGDNIKDRNHRRTVTHLVSSPVSEPLLSLHQGSSPEDGVFVANPATWAAMMYYKLKRLSLSLCLAGPLIMSSSLAFHGVSLSFRSVGSAKSLVPLSTLFPPPTYENSSNLVGKRFI